MDRPVGRRRVKSTAEKTIALDRKPHYLPGVHELIEDRSEDEEVIPGRG